jgi:hypothetical protein
MQSNSKIITFRREKNDFLTSLVEAQRLTVDGKEWLTAALDPFHDYNHQIAGYPDTDVSQTVVSCYQYETNIRAPPSVTGSATWDTHIYTLPIASSFALGPVYNETADWGRMKDAAPAVAQPLGPINYVAVPTGDTIATTVLPANVNARFGVLPNPGTEDISSGCSRVIAMGFEVHNTTAEIYKQGSVTTYRMPQSGNANQILFRTSLRVHMAVLRAGGIVYLPAVYRTLTFSRAPALGKLRMVVMPLSSKPVSPTLSFRCPANTCCSISMPILVR